MSHKFFGVMLLLFVGAANAQTPSEFEKRYGKPVVAYQVSESIWMTPEYTTDGQVCIMRLHPQRFSAKANYISPNLPFPELTKVLNQLVPLKTRGAKKEPFDTALLVGTLSGGSTRMRT
jgi:hypothetical protein